MEAVERLAQKFGIRLESQLFATNVEPERQFPAKGRGEQFVLAPPEKRGDEQGRQVQIVERLDGEPDRGEQVPDGERRRQSEPVESGDRNIHSVEACAEQSV